MSLSIALSFVGLAFAIPTFAVVFGLVLMGINRKLHARMQSRIGPPITQPFRDLFKLMCKENAVPDHAVQWLFNGAPFFGFVSALVIMYYLPIGTMRPFLVGYGDLILVLYLLALPALFLALGGFAAGSPYASVGAQREIVMMMSYELPLAAVVVSIATIYLHSGVFDPFALLLPAEHPPVWELVGGMGIVGLLILFATVMVVLPGELGVLPFDAPEAETELGGGIIAEYSGRNLGFIYLTDAVKKVVFGSLVVALFLPYGVADPLFGWLGFDVSDPNASLGVLMAFTDMLFYMLKVFAVSFVGVVVARVSFARLQIDRLAKFFLLPVTLMALLGMTLVWIDLSAL